MVLRRYWGVSIIPFEIYLETISEKRKKGCMDKAGCVILHLVKLCICFKDTVRNLTVICVTSMDFFSNTG